MEKPIIATHTGGGGNEPQGRQGKPPIDVENNLTCHPELVSGSCPRKIIPSPENINNITFAFHTAKRQVRGNLVPQKESETEWLVKILCHPELISGSYHRNIIPSPENINNISFAFHTAKRRVRGGCATPCKAAFTLAEVLITLGIIGVVAAMTMPTLIANYQKQETISKLQKVYTVLNQAFKLSEVDNGEFEYWDIDHDDPGTYFEKYWKPYFKIAKMCNTYQECGYEAVAPFLKANGQKETASIVSNGYRRTFITTDGVVLSTSVKGGAALDEDGNVIVPGNDFLLIFIDINGANRPNQLGKDFFYSIVTKKGVLAHGFGLPDDEVNTDCSKTGDGYYCLSKLIREGWKIKDDYPW